MLENLRERLALGVAGAAVRDLPKTFGRRVGARLRAAGDRPRPRRQHRFQRLVGGAEHGHPSDDVFELAHVARPGILHQLVDDRRRDDPVAAILRVEPFEESRRERGDFLTALTQRRNTDVDNGQTIEEIFAEVAVRERLVEVSIRRRDDARVDLDALAPADPRERQILKDVQQLGLQREGQIADLVEVDRAVVRVLELSELAPIRAGEGAALVAEQLGFQQLRRHRRAVHLHEESHVAARCRVNRAGDDVLADAALASDEHRRGRVGDVLHGPLHLEHRRTSAQEWCKLVHIACGQRLWICVDINKCVRDGVLDLADDRRLGSVHYAS